MKVPSGNVTFHIIDAMSSMMAESYQLARTRVLDRGSGALRALARHHHLYAELKLLRRENDVLRAQREQVNPFQRPPYGPAQRFEILQLMRLRGWSLNQTADRFILHPNTVRIWRHAVEGRRDPAALLGRPRWNRIDDAVRWAAHQLRRLCPDPEFGTRTIARHLVRSAVKVSRSWIQQEMRRDLSPRPKRPRGRKPALREPAGAEPHGPLTPEAPHDVWHMDFLSFRVLGLKFTVTALIDGYSRKLLALQACRGDAASADAIAVLQTARERYGAPQRLITDRGGQFQAVFKAALATMNITLVQGPARMPCFNGKVERLFKTFRIWLRLALLPMGVTGVQKQLDAFTHWYNHHRPHSAHGCLTPDEAWNGEKPPEAIPIRARDANPPTIRVKRRSCRGDPTLPIIEITRAA